MLEVKKRYFIPNSNSKTEL